MATVAPARAAIYARISQSDPNVEKTADQESRCRELAAREGYDVVDVFVDDGISAFTGKTRPAWLSLHDGVASNRFDVVLAVAEDRFARDAQEKIGFQVHCAKHGIVWHTLAGGRVDPSTAQGSLLSTITGAIAEYESHVKRERVRASVQRRIAEGRDLGGPRPFGFMADRMTPDPKEGAIVAEAYRVLLREGTVYAVTVFLNRSGALTTQGKKWGWSSVNKMLRRPRNAGIITHKGEVIREDGEQLVDRQTFDDALALLEGLEPVARGTKPSALGSWLLECGKCGNPMRNGGAAYQCTRPYFGTTDAARAARERDAVHPSITRHIADDVIRERTFLRMVELSVLAGGVEGNADVPGGDDGTLAILRVRKAEIQRQRDLAQEMGFMPGANLVDLRARLQGFADELEDVEAQIAAEVAADTKETIRDMARSAMKELAPGLGVLEMNGEVAFAKWRPRFDAMPVERQREIVRSLFRSVTVGEHGRGRGRVLFDPIPA